MYYNHQTYKTLFIFEFLPSQVRQFLKPTPGLVETSYVLSESDLYSYECHLPIMITEDDKCC